MTLESRVYIQPMAIKRLFLKLEDMYSNTFRTWIKLWIRLSAQELVLGPNRSFTTIGWISLGLFVGIIAGPLLLWKWSRY